MAFFQHCWRVVEADVMAFFEEFSKHCNFEKSLNVSFMSIVSGSPFHLDGNIGENSYL